MTSRLKQYAIDFLLIVGIIIVMCSNITRAHAADVNETAIEQNNVYARSVQRLTLENKATQDQWEANRDWQRNHRTGITCVDSRCFDAFGHVVGAAPN